MYVQLLHAGALDISAGEKGGKRGMGKRGGGGGGGGGRRRKGGLNARMHARTWRKEPTCAVMRVHTQDGGLFSSSLKTGFADPPVRRCRRYLDRFLRLM